MLKPQLDLAAAVIRQTRFHSIIRSLVLALVASELVGLFGHVGLMQALYLPMIVTLAIGVSSSLTGVYLVRAGGMDFPTLQGWFLRFIGMQAAISLAWGFLPWLLWEPHSPVNHLFLAAISIAITAGLVISRGGNMPMLIASLVPITLMTASRFALGETGQDWAVAVAILAFSFQLWYTGRPLVGRMEEDSRLRFQVTDMARELEETRDEALRKRFEAEAANASKTAFLANMSHELRTPLNAILGFSEIISQECFGPVGNARYKDYASDIHSSGAHLLSLINDLLDVAKIEAGRMEISPHPLDARRTFDIALKLISFKASEKRQTLTIHVQPSTPPLYADERALKQMLINLVSNAVKFTPEGGKIDVVASGAKGGGFQIMVRDNGPGIPTEKLANIFNPFSQVDNRYDRQAGGTGLGLALVRGLAELHGGRAWIESEPGAGCSAFIVLPDKKSEKTTQAA
ncbi:MAG TPA: ATP-binding protein [Rhizomicrobium sp.]|nr:ATP-binding protein [Rhizomicrobium sp.]